MDRNIFGSRSLRILNVISLVFASIEGVVIEIYVG